MVRVVAVVGRDCDSAPSAVADLVFQGVYQVNEQSLVPGRIVEDRCGVIWRNGIYGFIETFPWVSVAKSSVDIAYTTRDVCLELKQFHHLKKKNYQTPSRSYTIHPYREKNLLAKISKY